MDQSAIGCILIKFESPAYLQVCLAIADAAFANPVPPVAANGVSEEVRDASRVACNASVVHQADRMLRDLVGKRMREFRESSSSSVSGGEVAGEVAPNKEAAQVGVVPQRSHVLGLITYPANGKRQVGSSECDMLKSVGTST